MNKIMVKYQNEFEKAMLINFLCVFVLSLLAIVIKPLAWIVAIALLCLIATTFLSMVSFTFGLVELLKQITKNAEKNS